MIIKISFFSELKNNRYNRYFMGDNQKTNNFLKDDLVVEGALSYFEASLA